LERSEAENREAGISLLQNSPRTRSPFYFCLLTQAPTRKINAFHPVSRALNPIIAAFKKITHALEMNINTLGRNIETLERKIKAFKEFRIFFKENRGS